MSRRIHNALAKRFFLISIDKLCFIYFWISNPSMSSMFGSHSNYTITGTLGIKQQAAETFHVTSTDMNHYLNSVVRDIEEYANEVIREYQRNYPDDETNFKIEIDITLNIVD